MHQEWPPTTQEKVMPSKVRYVICLIALAFAASVVMYAQNLHVNTPAELSSRNREAIEVTRDEVRTQRKALLQKAVNLTDIEAQAFWPVYEEYMNELAKISDRTVTLITEFGDNYKDLSDSEALRMTRESLSIEQETLAVRQRFAERFVGILPGKKVARFFQIERRMDAVVVLNVRQAISLVE
jgi:hypothetical protein